MLIITQDKVNVVYDERCNNLEIIKNEESQLYDIYLNDKASNLKIDKLGTYNLRERCLFVVGEIKRTRKDTYEMPKRRGT